MAHYGIDISSNNTHPLNWAAIYAHLTHLGGGDDPFLVVKLTEGTGYVNPDDASDVAGWRNVGGKATAGYQFDHGNTDPDAEENFAHAHSLGLPVFDDIEDPAGLTVEQYKAHAQGLVVHNPGGLRYLNQSEVAEGFPADHLWLAQYNNQPGVTRYPCLIHQYADQAIIPGCAGTFDLNVWLGSEAAFDQFFALTPAQPAGTLIGKQVHMFVAESNDTPPKAYVLYDNGTKKYITKDLDVWLKACGQTSLEGPFSAAELATIPDVPSGPFSG